MELSGIHHLTAISAAIRENYRFYTRTLGMRLVKRTVNQDDVSAYHLFYADAKGSPGTDLTFFDWRSRENSGARAASSVPACGSTEARRWRGGRLVSTSIACNTVVFSNGMAA